MAQPKNQERAKNIFWGINILFQTHSTNGSKTTCSNENIRSESRFPWILLSTSSKFVVVSATDIDCLAGTTGGKPWRYILWNEMRALKKMEYGILRDLY